MKTIYLIVGKSATGKTSLAKYMEQKYGYKNLLSYTNRPRRTDNEYGHIFVSNEEYDKIIESKEIVAHAYLQGYHYCATEEQLLDNDFYIIDPVAAFHLKHAYRDNLLIDIKTIYLWTPEKIRIKRLLNRKGQTLQDAKRRIKNENSDDYKIKKDIVLPNIFNNCIPLLAFCLDTFIKIKKKFDK